MHFLERLLGANTKLRSAFLAVLASILVLNLPRLTDWLTPDLKDAVVKGAWTIVQGAVLFALAWGKQANVTGNGTVETPTMKADLTGLNRTLPLLLACVFLTGCGTTPQQVRDWTDTGVHVLDTGAGEYKKLKPLFQTSVLKIPLPYPFSEPDWEDHLL